MSHMPPTATLGAVTHDPTGWFDRTQATISVDDLAREVTLTPTLVPGYFDIFVMGERTRFSAPVVIPISDDEGFHYVYYDGSTFIDSPTFPDPAAFSELALTCFVYWDKTNTKFIRVCDERHGINMPWSVHAWLHKNQGTKYEGGFGVTAVTDTSNGNPLANDSQARIHLLGGSLADEDLNYTVVSDAAPTDPFEQDLGTGLLDTNAARLPVYYLSGALGVLRKADPDAGRLALKRGVTYPQYNLFSGGSWGFAEPASDQRIIYWLCVTNDQANPVFLMMGQGVYASLSAAQAVQSNQISWGASPPAEILVLKKIIFRVRSTFTNSAMRTKIEAVSDAITNTVTVPSTQSHSTLANLTYTTSGHTGFQQGTYVSAAGSPLPTNDSADTAGIGRSFAPGDFWVNQATQNFYGCVLAAPTAAVWVVLN
jgi:hypothetical protein